MTTTVEEYYTNILLSAAAYADLKPGQTDDLLERAIKGETDNPLNQLTVSEIDEFTRWLTLG